MNHGGTQAVAWNKGLAVGQKLPFLAQQLATLRSLLVAEGKSRDLALRDLAELRIACLQALGGELDRQPSDRAKKSN